MRWLSWESDVIRMASFLNERGIAAIGLRYHLNKIEVLMFYNSRGAY